MIVVKVELHSAITGKVTELGRMLICNDGKSTDSNRGDYDVYLGKKGQLTDVEVYNKPLKTAHIANYARNAYTVWELVKRALNLVRQ